MSKLHSTGLLPLEAAWEDLGFSVERRRRLRELSSDDPAERYLAMLQDLDSRDSVPGGSGSE
ncbi:hypothetical protein [Nocardiopsis sp. CNR-923]|uniref:hypothetical protein n=1 Tax=Nocardiopsis sp. CNR-923 TaxID=1904965 RepID=UPI00117E4601|nr:hypothetical protein [Nocardiopsis sp. CNR-923]